MLPFTRRKGLYGDGVSGLVKGGLAGLVAVGRKAVFNLNMTSPRHHIQNNKADITYVETKKEAHTYLFGKVDLLAQLLKAACLHENYTAFGFSAQAE